MAHSDRVPPHLRKFVVRQDYSQYDEIAQAVWRFVLLNTHHRLKDLAHPSYARGLRDTGMSLERIPRIEEMNDCLARYGWNAVCVDGFIPPMAFQEFQSLGILPIAAEIRTARHLTYTPAPDIIHEAAGHAPLLVDEEYSAFLRRVGDVGRRAFSLPEDRRVYQAIYTLSEVKEDPGSTREQVDAALQALTISLEQCKRISEAARVARLYWWTAEYGLIGCVDDYRIYGAGLLSSIGESYFCHEPSVRKLELSAECIETNYDITRPQPQLFVARDFGHLNRVLTDVSKQLAYYEGGSAALDAAIASQDTATVELSNGVQITGIVQDYSSLGDSVAFIQMGSHCAIGQREALLEVDRAPVSHQAYGFAVGRLEDGASLETISEETLRQHVHVGQLRLRYAGGVQLQATLRGSVHEHGRRVLLRLEDAKLEQDGKQLLCQTGPYNLVVADSYRTAFAGALCSDYYPATEFSNVSVPRPTQKPVAELALLRLYQKALESWRSVGAVGVEKVFENIHQELAARYPDEWLLRWNLLESLIKTGELGNLADTLRHELEQLEVRYQHREPIATGLDYLEKEVRPKDETRQPS